MQTPTLDRVALPGVAPMPAALRIALDEEKRQTSALVRHLDEQRVGMVRAMQRLGMTPYLGTKKFRRKPTKHVRHMRALAARSQKEA